MLRRLNESTFREFQPVQKVKYPPDHQPGIEVPRGGSMCLNCKFLGKDKKTCTEENFINWNGSNKLPLSADRYCSDWYMPAKRKV
jgi:hypothetical protein